MSRLEATRRHNFSDTPSEACECNLGIEDIRQFLYECPFYAIQRMTLAVNVIDILQRKNLSHLGNQPEVYVYGHPYQQLYGSRSTTVDIILKLQLRRIKHRPLRIVLGWGTELVESPVTIAFEFILRCQLSLIALVSCYIFVNVWVCHGFGLISLPSQ